MSSIIPFEYSGTPVRVVERDGEPWFVAQDVCGILGIRTDTVPVILEEDEHSKTDPDSIGVKANAPHGITLVSEPGLYSLILRSRKQEAKAFKRWITHEVIPQIRKTGSYTHKIPQTYPEALRALADQYEQIQVQEKELSEARPKAQSYDEIADLEGTFALSDIAKKLGWGPHKFTEQLRVDGVLFYRKQGGKSVNIPYQRHIDAGRFTVRTIQLDPLRQQTRVTGRGELWLAKHYGGANAQASGEVRKEEQG